METLTKTQKQIIYNLLSDKLHEETETYQSMKMFNEMDGDRHHAIKKYLMELTSVYNKFKELIK